MEKTCEGCDAKCCKYVALEIETPTELEDFENIKWYVAHKDVKVYVEEDGTWNVEFITPCQYLGEELGGRGCGYYEKRPQICRDYTQNECNHHNEYEELFSFDKIEDVEEYIQKIFNTGKHFVREEEE